MPEDRPFFVFNNTCDRTVFCTLSPAVCTLYFFPVKTIFILILPFSFLSHITK